MAPNPIPAPLGARKDIIPEARATAGPSINWIIDEKALEVQRLVKRGGAGTNYYHGTTYGTAPPKSTDTKYRGPPIPKIAGSEGGFWGLISGLAVLTFGVAFLLWFCLRRRKRRLQRSEGSGLAGSGGASTTGTHTSFTSLKSLFRPFSSRSGNGGDAGGGGAVTSSKRGWLQSSKRDWSELGDEDDFGTPARSVAAEGGVGVGGEGRVRAWGEEVELHETRPGAIGYSSPGPYINQHHQHESDTAIPLNNRIDPNASSVTLDQGGSVTHPYGGYDRASGASTSEVHLAPAGGQEGGGEGSAPGSPAVQYSDLSSDARRDGYLPHDERGFGDGRDERRPEMGERPLSGKFREG